MASEGKVVIDVNFPCVAGEVQYLNFLLDPALLACNYLVVSRYYWMTSTYMGGPMNKGVLYEPCLYLRCLVAIKCKVSVHCAIHMHVRLCFQLGDHCIDRHGFRVTVKDAGLPQSIILVIWEYRPYIYHCRRIISF